MMKFSSLLAALIALALPSAITADDAQPQTYAPDSMMPRAPAMMDPPPTNTNPNSTRNTLVDVLMANPDLTTLVQALRAADLLETLQNGSSLTIFAPNNQAFSKLPNGTLAQLMKPENKEKLKAILLYHVVPSKMVSSDLKNGNIKTANGKDLTVKIQGSQMKVNDATVTRPDNHASNGVVQVVDTVLLP